MMSELLTLAWLPGPTEWIIIGLLGLLFFGKKLPEVGKAVGQSIVEFKKGLKGAEEEISAEPRKLPAESVQQAGPRFDPYTGKPLSETNAQSK
jgi:sec-independent protein translocase protein TatA